MTHDAIDGRGVGAERVMHVPVQLVDGDPTGSWVPLFRLTAAELEVKRLREELDEARELLREAAWLHGLIEPDHPDWSASEHEEREERWLLDRAWPWLIVHGAHRAFLAARSSTQPTGEKEE